MNRFLSFRVFHDFELWMIDANPLSSQSWFSEHDELLTSRDHFLDVMKVEPPTDEWLTKRCRIPLLKGCFENLLPAAEASQLSLHNFPAQTHWRIAFVSGKSRKLMPILVTPWKMI